MKHAHYARREHNGFWQSVMSLSDSEKGKKEKSYKQTKDQSQFTSTCWSDVDSSSESQHNKQVRSYITYYALTVAYSSSSIYDYEYPPSTQLSPFSYPLSLSTSPFFFLR